MPCANTQTTRHFALKHGLNSPETDYFQIKIESCSASDILNQYLYRRKQCQEFNLNIEENLKKKIFRASALQAEGRGFESLSAHSKKPHNISMLWGFLFIDKITRNGQTIRYGLTVTMKSFTASNPHRLACQYIFRLFITQISLTTRLLARCLQTKKPLHDVQWLFRVGAEGFEPPTLCL